MDIEMRKKPLPGMPTVGVFGPSMSKFVFARLAWMVCSEDTRVYTGSGGMSLHPVRYCSCYWHLVCSRGYKQVRERERGSQVSGGRSERVLRARLPLSRVLVLCSCVLIPPFMGRPASPFIGEGKARVTEEEKEKERDKKASRVAGSFSFMRVPLIL